MRAPCRPTLNFQRRQHGCMDVATHLRSLLALLLLFAFAVASPGILLRKLSNGPATGAWRHLLRRKRCLPLPSSRCPLAGIRRHLLYSSDCKWSSFGCDSDGRCMHAAPTRWGMRHRSLAGMAMDRGKRVREESSAFHTAISGSAWTSPVSLLSPVEPYSEGEGSLESAVMLCRDDRHGRLGLRFRRRLHLLLPRAGGREPCCKQPFPRLAALSRRPPPGSAITLVVCMSFHSPAVHMCCRSATTVRARIWRTEG